MKQNYITHVVNLQPDKIGNVFDISSLREPLVQSKLKIFPTILKKPLSWQVHYQTFLDVSELKVPFVQDYDKMMEVYDFIEQAVQNTSSCLITSVKNKCATCAIAIVYLLFKFNWSVVKSVEFINARKIEFELTKAIIKQLNFIEAIHEDKIKEQGESLHKLWAFDKQVKLRSSSKPELILMNKGVNK